MATPAAAAAPAAVSAISAARASSGELAAPARARLMIALQQTVGNARAGRMVSPAASPAVPAMPAEAAAAAAPATVETGQAAAPPVSRTAAPLAAAPAAATAPAAVAAAPAGGAAPAAPATVVAPAVPAAIPSLRVTHATAPAVAAPAHPAPARAGGGGAGAPARAGGAAAAAGPAQAGPAPAAPETAAPGSTGEALPAAAPPAPAPAGNLAPRKTGFGIGTALDFFAEKANLIPGFRMFTIIIGVNPINLSRVERSAANILRAIVEFLPLGGLITNALDNHGIFERVGAWIEVQLRTLGMTGQMFQQALYTFLDSLALSDILHPGDVWERAKRIFSEPITRIINFVRGLVTQVLQFIRQAILLPLARLAEGTRGYDLLKAVLGQDPFTGQPVPRNAQTLVGGFLKLIGKEELWENIRKANAIARIWAWFQGALTELVAFVRQIPGLFMAALRALEIMDLVLVPRAFAKLVGVFGNFVVRFITWAGNAVWTLLQIVFEVVAPKVIPYLKKAAGAFRSILNNPIGFVGNLVKAAKLGFQKFADNILTHLKAGLIDWLTGSLTGVYIPKAFSLVEVGKFALSVLGISWAQIRGKIVKALGPNGDRIMTVLETTFDIVVALVKGGPAAAWEVIKEKLTNLKDMVIDGIIGFVTDMIVKKAIPKLISLFIPGAGFISAIMTIYDTVMVFVEKISKIIQVVTAFLDSIMAIAGGALEGAAKKVESVLAGLLSLAISFLAGFLGLGKVTDKIKEIIEKVRAAVDKALDKAIEWIVSKAKALFAAGKSAVQKVFNWAFARSSFTAPNGESHTILVKEQGTEPVLMIQSTPKTILEFLDEYITARGGMSKLKPDKQALVGSIKGIAKDQIAPLLKAINKAKDGGATFEALQPQRQLVLGHYTELSGLLSQLIGTDVTLAGMLARYKIEGLTGTYASVPEVVEDQLEADHQPQKSILMWLSDQDYFTTAKNMQRRAAGEASLGYAINLHVNRHKAGRTWGPKGGATKGNFIGLVNGNVSKFTTIREKREAAIRLLKDELRADASAIKGVVRTPRNDDKVWGDINQLSLTDDEKDKMVQKIKGQVEKGEDIIASQDLDSLAK